MVECPGVFAPGREPTRLASPKHGLTKRREGASKGEVAQAGRWVERQAQVFSLPELQPKIGVSGFSRTKLEFIRNLALHPAGVAN